MKYLGIAVGVMLAVAMVAGEAAAQRVGVTAKDTAVYRRLDDTIVSFTFNDQPLEAAIEFLQTLGGVNIVLDRKQVEEGKNVTLKLSNVTLTTAIRLITEQVDLKWAVKDAVVLISDEEGVKQEPITVVYPIDDLLAIPPDFQGPTMELQDLSSGSGSDSSSSSSSGIFGDDDDDDDDDDQMKKSREELLDELVDLIKAVIEPGTWDEG